MPCANSNPTLHAKQPGAAIPLPSHFGFVGICWQLWALLKCDVVLEMRRKYNLLSVVLFCALTLLLLRFSLSPQSTNNWRLTPRVLALVQGKAVSAQQSLALNPLLNRPFPTRQALVQALRQRLTKQPLTSAALLALVGAVQNNQGAPLVAGLLWVALLLGATLSLNRAFEQEREQGSLDILLLAPASRWVLYGGKMLACLLRLLVLQAILTPLTALFFGSTLHGAWLVLLPALLGGAVGIAALGALLGWLAAEIPGREALLPILLYPLLTPLLLAVVHLTQGALQGLPWHEHWPWLRLMLTFDAMVLLAAWLLFEHAANG